MRDKIELTALPTERGTGAAPKGNKNQIDARLKILFLLQNIQEELARWSSYYCKKEAWPDCVTSDRIRRGDDGFRSRHAEWPHHFDLWFNRKKKNGLPWALT